MIVAGPLLFTNPAVGPAGAMADETVVQRYATEFAKYLPQAPYNMTDDAIEFFTVHGVVDVDHSEAAAAAVARLATTEADQALVRDTMKAQTKRKLAKWRAIYEHYA